MAEALKMATPAMREVYVLGDEASVAAVRRLLQGFEFLTVRDGRYASHSGEAEHFVLGAVDFDSTEALQELARSFNEVKAVSAHKIIYASAPEKLAESHLLFAYEIDARFVAYGSDRNEELKTYIKRLCREAGETGSLKEYAEDLETARRSGDGNGLKKVLEKLKQLPGNSEEVTRLLAKAYVILNDWKSAEKTLKKLLRLNPQDLWAANALGRMYLRSGRTQAGIDVLGRLSLYHDLNGERLYELGNANFQVGELEDAEKAFRAGNNLNGGSDPKVRDALVKVRLERGDENDALSIAGKKGYSSEVVSYLNTKAIFAIRQDRIREGMASYTKALNGVAESNTKIKAKILFNIGLAFLRLKEWKKARQTFAESSRIGGDDFPKAARVLALLDSQEYEPESSDGDAPIQVVDGVDWEQFS